MSDGTTSGSRALTALVGVVATVLLGWVLIEGATILQPLVIAMLLCNILQPVVRALARFRIPPFVTVVALVLLLGYGVAHTAELLYSEVSRFLEEGGGLREVKINLLAEARDRGVPGFIADAIDDYDLRGELAPVFGTAQAFLGGVRGTLLVVLYMLFIFAEQAIFRRKIIAVAGPRSRDAEKVLDSISYGIQRYLGVKTVTSLATGVLCYSVLLYLQIPYALLFGFLTFLLNYIPTFGSIVAGIPPIATAWANSPESYMDPAIVAATYLAVNITLGSILEPRMLGRELNLSPLIVLVSVVVWAALWGVPGTFLAVPLTATFQIILANIESTRPIAVLLSAGPPRERRRRDREATGRGEPPVSTGETWLPR